MHAGCCLGALVLAAAPALAGPITPFNYLQLSDSPWLAQPGFAFEDNEDGVFNLVGTTPSAGAPFGPDGLTDSVDGDDGVVDGSGTSGHSFFSGDGNTGITFTLDADVIGFVPTRAGVVWTDGVGLVTFEAFDLSGDSLGVTSADIADNTFFGTTEEDHFFGFESAGGISAIKISNASGGIEVDHIQYAGGEVDDCPADCTGDGNLNILDFVCFQSAWKDHQASGDCDHNGLFNILDFVCFQGLFQQGCP
jgi:hypothetical protein